MYDFWGNLMCQKVAIWLEENKWGTGAMIEDKVREVTLGQGQIILGFQIILRTLAFLGMKSEAVMRFWTQVWCKQTCVEKSITQTYNSDKMAWILFFSALPQLSNTRDNQQRAPKGAKRKANGLWHWDQRNSSSGSVSVFPQSTQEEIEAQYFMAPDIGSGPEKLLPSTDLTGSLSLSPAKPSTVVKGNHFEISANNKWPGKMLCFCSDPEISLCQEVQHGGCWLAPQQTGWPGNLLLPRACGFLPLLRNNRGLGWRNPPAPSGTSICRILRSVR